MHLQFLGAAGTVTGSKYLVRAGGNQLLVDCGLFQGFKPLRLRNWADPPFDPAAISAVVLTHAHIDHSGYLPVLLKKGFRGRIFSSEATLDLCRILLPDSARLAEEDAERANRRGYSKHKPAQPLYTERDAKAALAHFVTVPFGSDFEPVPGLKASLGRAGHILGASTVRVSDARVTVAFSGDLGRSHDSIMRPPETMTRADFLLVESTYGDRRHDPADPDLQLAQIVSRTIARGGTVVIPSFAVGRTQALLLSIARLKSKKKIPANLPVFLNSPLAEDATAIYHNHRAEHRLSEKECAAMCGAAKIVNSIEESKKLNLTNGPKIIVAGSGMATGGRVIHHIAAFGPRPENTIVFAGFQAGGTRGAAMLAGAREVKIHGEYVPIRAEVAALGNLSAHADADELMDWLKGFEKPPRRTFVTHGEPAAADALRLRIKDELGWDVRVPEHLESVDLSRKAGHA
ncbi:MAG: MBL fold metallo-hydrolase [Alphaproteobacteria bacterium]|nr:MBL fold metallo-hydrolase [Alphaproteobacteria bacterium]